MGQFKFDKRAALYDEGFEGKFSKRFYALLLGCVALREGAVVLDVGCGTGTILASMRKACEIEGHGIDAEENMIAEAKKKCRGMDIRAADCARTPYKDQKFDIVTACMAYHHFDDREGFAREAARLLKPGGCLYIADPRFPWIVRKPLNAALRLCKIAGYFGTAKEIAQAFSAYGFELIDTSFDMYAQCIKLRKTP